MKNIIIVLTCLLCIGCTTKQKLIATYTVLHVGDYVTTVEILDNGGKEVGPLASAWIDEFGTDTLPIYFVLSEAFVIGLGEGVEYLWGKDACEVYWWANDGIKVIGVGNNMAVVYEMKFK